MKHTCFFFLVLLFAACSASDDAPRSEQIRADLLNPDCQRVLVASHRADWRGWPENSMPAIESAINMGVDIVELDLQCTADSQLIVMHDSKINRTTTGKGLVAEMTGTTRQIIMKGRKPADEVRALYGQYLDEVIYMPIVDMNDSASVETFSAHLASNPCAFELCWRTDDGYVREASKMAKGKALLWVNCLWDTLCGGHEDDQAMLDPDAHYGYLIDSLGFRIIQTDRPEYLINYLQSKHKR